MAEAKKTTVKTRKTKSTKIEKAPAQDASEKPQTRTAPASKVNDAVQQEETADDYTQTPDQTTTGSDDAPTELDSPKSTAKAGKRSAKAVAEAEEKQAKETRKAAAKAADDEVEKKPKQIQRVRSKLERRGKKYRDVAKLIEASKVYSLADAAELATKTSTTKFDASVELHVRLGVDPKHADQNIRDTVVLPAGTGKTVRIAVFAEAEQLAAAKKAGADIAAGEEFLQQLDKEKLDFDVLIATPQSMPKLGKYARVLGPKGLMPNPKSGTVSADVAKAVTEARAGRVEYRVDSAGIVHVAVGKVSFGAEKLRQNAEAVLVSIKSNKPGGIKGTYFRSAFLTTAMGPSIPVQTSEA